MIRNKIRLEGTSHMKILVRLATSAAIVLTAWNAQAQPPNPDPDGCLDTMVPGTPSVEGFVSANGIACPAHSWVQKVKPLGVDFLAVSAGSCEVYKKVGATCQLYQTQYRGIGITRVYSRNDPGYTAVYPNPNTLPVNARHKTRRHVNSRYPGKNIWQRR